MITSRRHGRRTAAVVACAAAAVAVASCSSSSKNAAANSSGGTTPSEAAPAATAAPSSQASGTAAPSSATAPSSAGASAFTIPSGDKTLHMGLAVANISLNFAHEMVEGAQQAVAHTSNIDFKVVGPPNTDGPAEETLFKTLLTTATDGAILENLDPPIFSRTAAQGIDNKIPIAALDTAPMPDSKITFYVGNDNYKIGAMLAQEAIKRMGTNPSGTVIVGEPNPGTPVLDSRVQGIKDTFAQSAPNVKVKGPYQTYSDPAQNYNAWLAQVHANPNALAFLGVGDADSYDLAKIKQAEHGKYLVAGTDVDAKTLEDVKAGLDFVTIDPEHFLKGYIVTAILIDSVRQGKPLPTGWFETPEMVVDQSNVDAIIAREKTPEASYSYYEDQINSLLAGYASKMQPLSKAR
jgi:ribose transport system substrate-binding protein